jgi:hypothetical protein
MPRDRISINETSCANSGIVASGNQPAHRLDDRTCGFNCVVSRTNRKRRVRAKSPSIAEVMASVAISVTSMGIRIFDASSMPPAMPRATIAAVIAMKTR